MTKNLISIIIYKTKLSEAILELQIQTFGQFYLTFLKTFVLI